MKHIAHVGVPVNILPGGDLTKVLAHENRSGVGKFDEIVWEKALADVEGGKAIVFPKQQAGQVPGLRVSPIGIVEEHKKIRYPRHDFSSTETGNTGVGECGDRLG